MISIIPVFLPQKQCQYDCIFCNQGIAVGQIQELTAADITDTLNTALATISEGAIVQAGFYGGSFTILPEEKQEEYLEAVLPFIKSGRINGVRISTRPDAIDDANIKFLKIYGLQTVELGAQILDDQILALLRRGHTSDDIVKAVTILKENGIKAGLQLMTGLPGETMAGRYQSFDKVLQIKPDFLRIHPTLVLKGSELEEMYKKGEYIPLTIDEAVSVCADLVILSESAGIPVIRIGLQSSCSLQEEDSIIAGPWHPSFGQMVRSEIYFRMFEKAITELKAEKIKGEVGVQCSDPDTMKGLRKSTLKKIKDIHQDIDIVITKNKELSRNQMILSDKSGRDIKISISDIK